MMQIEPFRPGQYSGYSYAGASKRAMEIIQEAVRTGQSIILSDHLTELAKVMKDQSVRRADLPHMTEVRRLVETARVVMYCMTTRHGAHHDLTVRARQTLRNAQEIAEDMERYEELGAAIEAYTRMIS